MAKNVREIILENLKKKIQNNDLRWAKEWIPTVPRRSNGEPYRGINTLILMLEGYKNPFWLTFKQIKKEGGKVKKGEKGTPVVFFKYMEKEDEEGNVRTFPILRYYTVFNVEQTEGLPEKYHNLDTGKNITPVEEAEQLVDKNAIVIEHGEPAYHPIRDRITMPPMGNFSSKEAYYATLFHEMIHWTGHETRLDRDLTGKFGDAKYAHEELIAEIGSLFMCAETGIDSNFTNSAAYVASWIKKTDNPKSLFDAASSAQKAADYLIA